MINHPTKYESYRTTILKMHEKVKSPITPTKFVESKWQNNMLNYTYS
jgi:hypothetical protein